MVNDVKAIEKYVEVLISATARLELGIGGWPSASRIATPCLLLWLRGASKNLEQCRFSDSQYSSSKEFATILWPAPASTRQLCGKKAAQWLGAIGPLLNGRSGLSVRNGLLLYKQQLLHVLIDYACPIWRSAASDHVRKLQVLHSNCLRIATNAPW
jgi:hypothetical protein